MNYSGRLPANLSVNRTTRAIEALRARGIPIVDLTVSNPTCVGLHYPEDLLASLASARGLDYHPHALGLGHAREAVAADYGRRGIDVSPSRIALTASTSEAYSWLFKLLCDPGDNVLVPRPSYPLFEHLTVLEAIAARPYRLEYHDEWRIDLESLTSAIDSRTRALLVVTPNNPTGSVIEPDELAALVEIAAANQLAIIGDEVFADYLHSEAPVRSVVEHAEVVTFSLGGLSKTVGLPQVKLAWIAFGGPSAKLDPLMAAYELIADTYLSVATPVQVAAADLLTRGAPVREQIRRRIRRNLTAMMSAVSATKEISLLRTQGGWSAVLRVPAYRSEESLVLSLLTDDHVLVHPGFFFDFDHEAFLVVSLLPAPADFDRGIDTVLARAKAGVA